MRIPTPARTGRSLKILMRIRRDALSHPGGDTVVMEKLREGLRRLGHTVDLDLESGSDASRYDIVHLSNLTLPGMVAPFAAEASAKGVPFVIHGFLEDWPRFLNRALAAALVLQKYVSAGQPRDRLEPALALLRECPAAEAPFCPEAAAAAAILCSGSQEAETSGMLYPTVRTAITHVGIEPGRFAPLDGEKADFRRAFDVDDFVLCVGRLEPRKNQLMLLAALEDSDVTVVFADGGFGYAPEYTEACRTFKRRGRTVFTGRLSPALLLSAYATARVSCLPSWYELPGIVTLEAAYWGNQVVTTPCGTIGDYLGGDVLLAEPEDFRGLGSRVLDAWERPPNPALRLRASEFTWARSARETERVYLEILAKRAS
jgi:glycosyltransferase involved in cell wall biosynthesis